MKRKIKKGFELLKKKYIYIKTKILDKDFLKENIKVVILGILLLIFLMSTIVYVILSKNISKIEEQKIREESIEYSNYLEDIKTIKGNNLDKYIIFTLDYSKNANNQNKLTSDEISEFITTRLNKKTTAEEVRKYGINGNMLDRNITYNSIDDTYIMNDVQLDRKQIAEDKIIYYRIKSIKKVNKKKYVIKYEQYIIEEPYELLNKYLEINRKNIEDDIQNDIDLTLIKNYLTTGNKSDIKHFFNTYDKELSNVAKKSGRAKITYVIDDNGNTVIHKIR